MNNIMTIVKKEFKDILRDRKTLLMTFVIPIIVMPLLFTFIFSSIGDMASPSEDNKYKIVLETNNPEITALFKEAGIYELVDSKDPRILLCDEATSALDPDTTKSILELLLKINKKLNITIIMITHQMEVVQRICNHIAVMSEGKVIEEGTVKEIFTSPQHSVTKSFIQEGKNHNEFDETVLKKIYSKGRLLKVVFDENVSRLPILTKVIRECDSDINVIEANLSNTIDSSFGIMILQVIGDYEKVITLFEKYLAKVEVM